MVASFLVHWLPCNSGSVRKSDSAHFEIVVEVPTCTAIVCEYVCFFSTSVFNSVLLSVTLRRNSTLALARSLEVFLRWLLERSLQRAACPSSSKQPKR